MREVLVNVSQHHVTGNLASIGVCQAREYTGRKAPLEKIPTCKSLGSSWMEPTAARSVSPYSLELPFNASHRFIW